MNTITLSKEEQIANAKAILDREIAIIDDRIQYRMDNYYAGIDDYSWGGLCDKADMEHKTRIHEDYDIRVKQINNGGYHTKKTYYLQLVDLSTGEIVARGINYGKFGEYFSLFEGGYIGLPKRLATLTRKGYAVEAVTNEWNLTTNCERTRHNNYIYTDMELVNHTVTRFTDNDISEIHIGNSIDWVDYFFENYFNK